MDVPGLYYYTNVLNEELQTKLLEEINSREWSNKLSRRTQQYGYEYDYTLREPNTRKLKQVGKTPKSIKTMADCLHKVGLLENYPNQIIVNEYTPGQGIGKHRDHHPIFADGIAIFSLASGCTMIFRKISNPNTSHELYLEKGSMLIMSGDARYKWTHEIPNRKSDVSDSGVRINRDTRISITFRHVNENFCKK